MPQPRSYFRSARGSLWEGRGGKGIVQTQCQSGHGVLLRPVRYRISEQTRLIKRARRVPTRILFPQIQEHAGGKR